MSRIKSFYIHENMKRMKSCHCSARLRSNMSPQMSLDSPKGRRDQPSDSRKNARTIDSTDWAKPPEP